MTYLSKGKLSFLFLHNTIDTLLTSKNLSSICYDICQKNYCLKIIKSIGKKKSK